MKDFQKLYEKSSVTMNVHLLRHFVHVVKNLGPLWSYSTFGFESKNGVLKNYVNGTGNVLSQVVKRFILSKCTREPQRLVSTGI